MLVRLCGLCCCFFFFFKEFDYYYIYLFTVCPVALGSRGKDMPWHMCGQEDNFWALGVGFLFTTWVSRTFCCFRHLFLLFVKVLSSPG